MTDKATLLAAIAAAGTQGRVDYEQAKAQSSQLQADALRAALSGSVAQAAPSAAQQEIARIIGQPYQAAQQHLDANAQAQETWMNHAKWNTGVFQGNLDMLKEALLAQALAEGAGGGGGSGGGGSGGGGGDGEMFDWYENLKDQYGTQAIAKGAIEAEAKNLYSWKDSKVSPHEYAANYAEFVHGVPKSVGQSWYKQPKADQEFAASARSNLKKMPHKQYMAGMRNKAKKLPGSQKYIIQEFKAKSQARRKKNKPGKK